MKPIATFNVEPALPARLAPLREIAANLRWSWDPDAIILFRRLDQDGWEAARHNPVLLLGSVDQDRLETAAADEGFLAHMDRVARGLDEYLAARSTWFGRTHGPTAGPVAAYFSAEFGLTESLPLFAGGLGVLAGDHLKSSSDLGLPIVGLGLLYRQGYFRQHLTLAGRQHESYEDNDFSTLPRLWCVRPAGRH